MNTCIERKRSVQNFLTIVQDDQERRQQVTHPLDVAHLQVLPDVAEGESREPRSKHHEGLTLTLTLTDTRTHVMSAVLM